MSKKQISLKLSTVTLAVLLASCGGGGSEGYFNEQGSGSTIGSGSGSEVTAPKLSEKSFIEIDSSQPTLNINGDKASITIRLTDKNGGGVASKPVTLVLDETSRKNGLINSGVSAQNTDENGYAIFTISLKQATSDVVIAELLKNGVNISAVYTETDKTQAVQTLNLRVIDSDSSVETALYNLRLKANKQLLNVKGDNAIITVQVVNNNGAVISGQNITLKVLDAKNNFVILAKDKAISDSLGESLFEISIPSELSTEQKNLLVTNGIQVEASVTDENKLTTIQNFTLRVSATEGSQAVPNITFGRTQKLATVNNELDYQETLSVRVVDKDGNPIPDTDFTINMQVVQKASGHFVLGKTFEGLLAQDKAILKNDIEAINFTINTLNLRKSALESKKLNNPIEFTTADQNELDEIPAKVNDATDELKDVKLEQALLDVYEIPKRIQYSCTAQKTANDIATKLTGTQITNIGNTYTATTDKDGQFKFELSYFKTYAAWQTIRLNVKPKNESVMYSMSYDYPLGLLKSDFESEDTQPFDMSPYNSSSLISPCPTTKPWAGIL
ncbi:Ig-like domain-containing protein [Acinetobacter terrae]|uniref:Ig-like domain-containing protein n=1 Tax=Acinetobacter terrae TaxID=2731247 RepID=A0ABX1V3F1_9GAMM|nr:Ig-like domain-containing protein [Acinetobacter terrae]NNH88166.1 Ig-like domain-containing protein [Acinetobacter terrae]